ARRLELPLERRARLVEEAGQRAGPGLQLPELAVERLESRAELPHLDVALARRVLELGHRVDAEADAIGPRRQGVEVVDHPLDPERRAARRGGEDPELDPRPADGADRLRQGPDADLAEADERARHALHRRLHPI